MGINSKLIVILLFIIIFNKCSRHKFNQLKTFSFKNWSLSLEIYGKKVNLKSVSLFLLHFLIFADILFISVALLLDLPDDTSFYIIIV